MAHPIGPKIQNITTLTTIFKTNDANVINIKNKDLPDAEKSNDGFAKRIKDISKYTKKISFIEENFSPYSKIMISLEFINAHVKNKPVIM